MNTSGLLLSLLIVSESNVVLSLRESIINDFLFLLHLLSPIPAPPRCMMTSKPSMSSGLRIPSSGFQDSSLAPSLTVLRTSLHTSWPPVSKKATSCVPINPDEPAIKILFLSSFTYFLCSRMSLCNLSSLALNIEEILSVTSPPPRIRSTNIPSGPNGTLYVTSSTTVVIPSFSVK